MLQESSIKAKARLLFSQPKLSLSLSLFDSKSKNPIQIIVDWTYIFSLLPQFFIAEKSETMAVDVCSEAPSLISSPRISFSHDLNQTDTVPIEPYLFDPNFAFDFDFSICKSFTQQEFPSADELFSNGKILPVEIKKQVAKTKEKTQQLEPPTSVCQNVNEKKRLKELLYSDFEAEEVRKPLPKSKWNFNRSSSLNLESRLIRSLQFLSRSNSTGSAPNRKQTEVSKDNRHQNLFKQPPVVLNSRSSSSFCAYYPYNSAERPPLKKDFRSYSNGGVRISPVLNIPHNCIGKGTVSLFGFGSLLCNRKAKNKKK